MRRKPNSVDEMLSWGMISFKTYEKVKHLSLSDANAVISDYYGYQTWSFGEQHFDELLKSKNIAITDFTRYEWVNYILRASKGRVNPAVVDAYYLKHVSTK